MGLFSRLFGNAKSSTPPEPPIQNLDSVDITGQRREGGVDLVIVASSHLDGSLATQKLLTDKLETYIAVLNHPEFIGDFGVPHPDRAGIIIECTDQPADE